MAFCNYLFSTLTTERAEVNLEMYRGTAVYPSTAGVSLADGSNEKSVELNGLDNSARMVEINKFAKADLAYQKQKEQNAACKDLEAHCIRIRAAESITGDSPNFYHYYALKPIALNWKKDWAALYEKDYVVRQCGRKRLLYRDLDVLTNFIHAAWLLIGHLFHSIVRKFLMPIFLAPLLLMPMEKVSSLKEVVKEDWKRLMPIKALFGAVMHLVLDLLALLTFGYATTYFNLLSGDIERWVIGDDINEKTWIQRISKGLIDCCGFNKALFARYLAPCKQPLFTLSEQSARPKDHEYVPEYASDKIYQYIREHEMQAFLREMVTGGPHEHNPIYPKKEYTEHHLGPGFMGTRIVPPSNIRLVNPSD